MWKSEKNVPESRKLLTCDLSTQIPISKPNPIMNIEQLHMKEVLAARPSVFEETTYPIVRDLATRYLRLRDSAQEREDLETERDLKDIHSVDELRLLVNERVSERFKLELSDVLAHKPLPGASRDSTEQKDVLEQITTAVATYDFSSFGESDPELHKLALGCAAIAERARTSAIERALKDMEPADLERFTMTAPQRDAVVSLLHACTKLNAEYLRHKSRVMSSAPYEAQAVDSVRERMHLVTQLEAFQVKFTEQSRTTPVFGEHEDRLLQTYIESIAQAYTPFDTNGNPVGNETQQKLIENAHHAFYDLYSTSQSMPLIIAPPLVHYDASAAVTPDEGMGEHVHEEAWRQYGYDPELRLYWQSADLAKRQEIYHAARDTFADVIEATCHENVEAVRSKVALVGHLLGAGGISMSEAPLGQEDTERQNSTSLERNEHRIRGMVLIVERPPQEVRDEFFAALEHFGINDTSTKLIIENESFPDLYAQMISLHEFGHAVAGDRTTGADKLDSLDDSLMELKSDLAMAYTTPLVLEQDARIAFGDSWKRSLNTMSVIDVLRSRQLYAGPEISSDDPYAMSCAYQCKLLLNCGVLTRTETGYVIDTNKISDDLSSVFHEPYLKVLELYRAAENASESDELEQVRLRATAFKHELVKLQETLAADELR